MTKSEFAECDGGGGGAEYEAFAVEAVDGEGGGIGWDAVVREAGGGLFGGVGEGEGDVVAGVVHRAGGEGASVVVELAYVEVEAIVEPGVDGRFSMRRTYFHHLPLAVEVAVDR